MEMVGKDNNCINDEWSFLAGCSERRTKGVYLIDKQT
jgi:hypothetical protein